jgi:hypothetical protein
VKAATTVLERVAIVVASLALSFGLIAVLSGFFAGRDQAGVSGTPGTPTGPGSAFPDLGHAHLKPGASDPAYDSDPPTSGAHVPEPITRDEARIDNNQLLQALEVGDVVLMYPTRKPPAGLRALARAEASPFTPALAAAGQAVILAQRPGVEGVVGLAWAHAASVRTASDPRLAAFVQFWLGRGAPDR